MYYREYEIEETFETPFPEQLQANSIAATLKPQSYWIPHPPTNPDTNLAQMQLISTHAADLVLQFDVVIAQLPVGTHDGRLEDRLRLSCHWLSALVLEDDQLLHRRKDVAFKPVATLIFQKKFQHDINNSFSNTTVEGLIFL